MCGPHEGTEFETSYAEVEWPELLVLQSGWFRMMGTGFEEPLVLSCVWLVAMYDIFVFPKVQM